MKSQLRHVKTALEKAETLTQRVTALETEKLDLRLAVQDPSKAGAAKVRLDALPGELAAVQHELDKAANAFRLALREIPALMIENKTGKHAEAEKITREFLQAHLVDSRQIHGGEAFVEDLIHKIASNFKAVRLADSLVARFPSHRFSTMGTDQHIHLPELFALANDCLESLAEI